MANAAFDSQPLGAHHRQIPDAVDGHCLPIHHLKHGFGGDRYPFDSLFLNAFSVLLQPWWMWHELSFAQQYTLPAKTLGRGLEVGSIRVSQRYFGALRALSWVI